MRDTTSFAERRSATRFAMSTKGWLMVAPGRAMEFRTSDLSVSGAGILHTQPLIVSPQPMKMLLSLSMLDLHNARIDAEAEVRYSVHSQGAYRSGVMFRNLTPAQAGLLAAALKGRLPVIDC